MVKCRKLARDRVTKTSALETKVKTVKRRGLHFSYLTVLVGIVSSNSCMDMNPLDYDKVWMTLCGCDSIR